MTSDTIIEEIRAFVATRILDGEDVGLTASTPLLELGVLNSMEVLILVAFLEKRFGVAVPPPAIVADNFKDLSSIASLLVRLGAPPGGREPGGAG